MNVKNEDILYYLLYKASPNETLPLKALNRLPNLAHWDFSRHLG